MGEKVRERFLKNFLNMNINSNRLLQIADDLGFEEISTRIKKIAVKLDSKDCPLMLPLVGEFSSGKTTLINSLTDSKALETATKPTTATIFEVHFGADKCEAIVVDDKGQSREVSDISSLKNSELGNAAVVTVFDTSKKVPSSIVLVDTPGLSSSDPRHRQTLIDFLPEADAVLLVVDINAQLTRSLTEFVKTMSLSNRRLYLVLTKADSKADSEIEATKKYLEDNLHIDKQSIICVSARRGNVDELLDLFDIIQNDKAQILDKVNEQRLRQIAKDLSARIGELLKAPADDKEAAEKITQKRLELNKIQHEIDNAIETSREDIEAVQRNVSRTFEDTIAGRLEVIAAGGSDNFDQEAVSAINNTASLVLNDYKNGVKKILHEHAKNSIKNEGVDLSILESVDVSDLNINGLSYNLDLNSLGHGYDGIISTGVKVAAAAALAAAAIATAGAAAGAAATAGGTSAASAASIGTIASVADTATDVGSMIVGGKIIANDRKESALVKAGRKIEKAEAFTTKMGEKYISVEETEQQFTSGTNGNGRGIVTSMVGFVTDKTMGKPQRRRAIHEYMDGTLMPQFQTEIERMTDGIVDKVRQTLNEGAESAIKEITDALENLREAQKNKKTEYSKRISTLRDYKNELALM